MNITNNKGCLPLHYAVSFDEEKVIEAVSNGCTMKYKQNNLGKTPLHIACETSLCKYQFVSIQHFKSRMKGTSKHMADLICVEEVVNIQDNQGNTPLHIACRKGYTGIAVYLTSNFQCDLDLPNYNHCLPLHYAASCLSLELVRAVSSGCTQKCKQNMFGKTPLHIACEQKEVSNQYEKEARFNV